MRTGAQLRGPISIEPLVQCHYKTITQSIEDSSYCTIKVLFSVPLFTGSAVFFGLDCILSFVIFYYAKKS